MSVSDDPGSALDLSHFTIFIISFYCWLLHVGFVTGSVMQYMEESLPVFCA